MNYLNPPYPPQSNPVINPQYYQPSRFVISNISRGRTTTVTMTPTTIRGITVQPNYVIGQQVRIIMTFGYGIPQINNRVAYVVSIPTSTSVVLDIDSTNYNAFISSPSHAPTPAQIIAIGDVNPGALNLINSSMSTVVPGSFIDISPN